MSNGPTTTTPTVSTADNYDGTPPDAVFQQLLKRWIKLTTSSSPPLGRLQLQSSDGKKDSKELIHSGLKGGAKSGSEVSETTSPSGWTTVKLGCAKPGSSDSVVDNSTVVNSATDSATATGTAASTAVVTSDTAQQSVQSNGLEDEIKILRSMALQLMQPRGIHVDKYGDRKHFTTVLTYTTVAAAAPHQLNLLATLASGTGINNRIGNSIRLHRIRLKYDWRLARNGAVILIAAGAVNPVASMDVWVDKLPATAGGVTAVYIVGANPETNSVSLYTNCGGALTSDNPVAEIFPMRNYNTIPDYEILHHHTHLFQPEFSTTYDSKLDADYQYMFGNMHVYHEKVFDFRDTIVQYAAPATAGPITNAICLTGLSSTTAAQFVTIACVLQLNYLIDVEFSDTTDD